MSLEECVRRGKYKDYLSLIERSGTGVSMISLWIQSNNKLVAEYKLSGTQGQVTRIQQRLLDLCTQVKGLPSSESVLHLYSVVVHNLVHVGLSLALTSGAGALTSCEDISTLLINVLIHVCEYEGLPVLPAHNPDLGSVCDVVLQNHQSLPTVLLLVHDAALLLVIMRNYVVATPILRKLSNHIEQINSQQKMSSIASDLTTLLCLTCNHANDHLATQLYDITQQVLALAYSCNGQYEASMQCVQGIETRGKLEEEFVYLKAWLSWCTGDHSSCVRICHNLLANTNCSSKLTAKCRNLIGCCLAKQGKPHLAIQHYQAALNDDPFSTQPLYNISLQYRHLGTYDAELECLNLITTALASGVDSTPEPTSFAGDVINARLQLHLGIELSHKAVLYTLAKRCMELQRFEVAVTKYDDLVQILKSDVSASFSNMAASDTGEMVVCAGIEQVYTELAYCLLSCGQYDRCIDVCDLIANSTSLASTLPGDKNCHSHDDDDDDDFLNMLTDDTDPPTLGEGKTKAKQGCAFDASDSLCVHQTLLYKAESLFHTGHMTDSVHTLTRVIEAMESAVKTTYRGKNRHELSTETSELPEVSLLHSAHINLAVVLVTQRNLTEAIHHSRLALIYKPGSTTAHYTHTLVLFKLSQRREAANHWLMHRGIDTQQDGLQMARILQEKCDVALTVPQCDDDMRVSMEITDADCDRLDVMCLRVIAKSRQ